MYVCIIRRKVSGRFCLDESRACFHPAQLATTVALVVSTAHPDTELCRRSCDRNPSSSTPPSAMVLAKPAHSFRGINRPTIDSKLQSKVEMLKLIEHQGGWSVLCDAWYYSTQLLYRCERCVRFSISNQHRQRDPKNSQKYLAWCAV